MRIRSLATCLVLVLAGLLVPTVAHAAAPVAVATCGAVLTTDAYLSTDLTCPGPNGLSIGANITLDLRHHKLTGPGSTTSGAAGIAILDGFSVQLSNGTVQKWGTGIGFIERMTPRYRGRRPSPMCRSSPMARVRQVGCPRRWCSAGPGS